MLIMVMTMECDFKEVGNCEEILLAFRVIGMFERVKLTFKSAYFYISVGILIEDLIIFLEQDVRWLERKRHLTKIRLRPNL